TCNKITRVIGLISAVSAAKTKVARAEQTVEEAKAEAKRRARQRLNSANFEESFQNLKLLVEKTAQVLERRKADQEKQLKVVASRKAVCLQTKEEAARALQKLDEQLTAQEADLKSEEEHLLTLVNGSPEHATLTTKISDLKADAEELRGKRNAALALFNSKERFAKQLETYEQAHQRTRDSLLILMTSLKSDNEERMVTFRSRLELQKGLNEVMAGDRLDEVGVETDRRNLQAAVAVTSAIDRMLVKKFEKHPERIKDIEATRAAWAEHTARIRERYSAIIERYKENYGIDPTGSSYFNYPGEGGNTPA
ncbi:MAG: hypothetical protein AAB288_02675, partial [Acidobacteriota bacterium]